jgi:prepilin-type processing-associated H-X9-DG protein
LNRALTESGTVLSDKIPLLGDSAPGDVREALLSSAVGSYEAGARLVESFTDGPIVNDTMKPPTFAAGTVFGGPTGWWHTWATETLQDYRDFAPVHGSKDARYSNILFADGSVRSYTDRNADGFLNPGFDPTLYTGTGVIGYTSPEIELPTDEVYSGFNLRQESKGNLDVQ